jgi:ABC-2 type transport system ATP-binding protein
MSAAAARLDGALTQRLTARGLEQENGVTLAIDTEHLTKYYGASRGIIDVDLDVEAGDVYGFLGPNGAGKTTTIRVLLDLIRPTSGSATVLGLDARRDGVAIRRRVGYLPGEYALYPKLTGAETLRYYGNLRGGVDWSHVEALAARLDFDLKRRTGDLSTGNKRKLGLIQAFMHRPELVILDEPTAGLDPLVRREFYAMVDEAHAAGQTIFLSSHVLPEVQRVCSRAGFVREGRLVAVEDVVALGKKAVHHVEIEFAGPAPQAEFQTLSGVDGLTATDHRLAFTVSGTLDAVVKAAARHEVIALTSHEPDLEDLFLAYYGGGAGDVA